MHDLGLHANIGNADYHAGPGISSTGLKRMLKCPRLYKAYIDGELEFNPTPAMRLGTAVHSLVLERERFYEDIAVMPAYGRKKADQEAKAEFVEVNGHKTIITEDQKKTAELMAESLLRLPDVQRILESGEPELSGYYEDEDTGLLCKYRPDFRTDWCIFDIKTCVDLTAHGFSNALNKLNYHVSAAHYLEGDIALRNVEHEQFTFGCVESSPPYLACAYKLDAESLELGRRKRAHALRGIQEGHATGVWHEYNHGVTVEIGVPRWAL